MKTFINNLKCMKFSLHWFVSFMQLIQACQFFDTFLILISEGKKPISAALYDSACLFVNNCQSYGNTMRQSNIRFFTEPANFHQVGIPDIWMLQPEWEELEGFDRGLNVLLLRLLSVAVFNGHLRQTYALCWVKCFEWSCFAVKMEKM